MRLPATRKLNARQAVLAALTAGALPARAAALDTGLDATAKVANLQTGQTDIAIILGKYINTAISYVGVLFMLLAVYAGYLWMTAQGEPKQVDKAKGILKNAIVGLVVVMASYAITSFVVLRVGETIK